MESTESDQTSGQNGGGSLFQTYTWTEKYDPCFALYAVEGKYRQWDLQLGPWSGWENNTSWDFSNNGGKFPPRPGNR